MNMKEHILAAMREQFNRWEELLKKMPVEQIRVPLTPSNWSTKDVMSHLWAWQQRSIAKVEAARSNREPRYPEWVPGSDPASDGDTEQTNAWIYETYKEKPWPGVHQDWMNGYLLFLEVSEGINERDLLDSDKFAWLGGYSLAIVYLSSYDHHLEHFEKLMAWLDGHGRS